jgi:hypothetical protein
LGILKAKEKAELDDSSLLGKQHSEEIEALWWKDENI